MNRETNAWPVEKSELDEKVKDVAQNTKEVASDTIEAVKENASKYYQEGVKKAQELQSNLEDKIKKYPLKSLLIAAGVGSLLGILLKRR